MLTILFMRLHMNLIHLCSSLTSIGIQSLMPLKGSNSSLHSGNSSLHLLRTLGNQHHQANRIYIIFVNIFTAQLIDNQF